MARKKDDALHVKRKSQILAAARACFIEHGIHQTSMQQICARGEISPVRSIDTSPQSNRSSKRSQQANDNQMRI